MSPVRITTDDGEGGGSGGTGTGTASPVYFDLNWTYATTGSPAMALSLDVALYTGTNPDTQANWIGGQLYSVPPEETRLVVSHLIPPGVTLPAVKFSIREVFPWGKGAWNNVGGTVTPAPLNINPQASDNLIPNYNSELGATPLGVASALVVNDAANAVAGNYVRKLDTSATNLTDLTAFIPCMPGDQFYLEAMAKVSAAGPGVKLRLTCYDASFAVVGSPVDSVAVTATAYAAVPTGVTATVPATAVYVKAQVFTSTTSASKFGYFDQLLFRRVDGQTIQVAGSQVFTSAGTFVVPTGVTRLRVIAQGPGGGGGSGQTNVGGGGGGGAGATGMDILEVTPGQVITINSVGLGGNGASASNTQGSSGSGNTIVSWTLPDGLTSAQISVGPGVGGFGGGTKKGGDGGAPQTVRGRNSAAGIGSLNNVTSGGSGAELFIVPVAWCTGGGGGGFGGDATHNALACASNWTYFGKGFVSAGAVSGLFGGGGGGCSALSKGGPGGGGTTSGISAGGPPATDAYGNAGPGYGGGGGGGGATTVAFAAGGKGGDGCVIFQWGPGI